MIDAHRIVYNGLDSLDLNLTPHLCFDSDNGAASSFLNRDAIFTEVYDGSRKYIHGSKYIDSAMPKFTLIKQDFSDFTSDENRRVLSWLTSSSKPSWLEVYQDDSNVYSYRYFCVPTTVEQYKLSNGRVVGYEFEIFSDAPYAWSRNLTYPEKKEETDSDSLAVSEKNEFTITCNTDEYNKPVYPKITVTFKGKNKYFPVNVNPLEENTYPMVPNVIYSWMDTAKIEHLYVNLNSAEHNGKYEIGVFDTEQEANNSTMNKYYYFSNDDVIKVTVKTIENGTTRYHWESVTKIGMAVKIGNTYEIDGITTTKESIIAGGAMDEVIVIDGMNKLISGTRGTTAKVIGDHFNWEWIPLIYGENKITVMGNCRIKFEWLEPRKVGNV